MHANPDPAPQPLNRAPNRVDRRLHSQCLHIERKHITLDLRENALGQFLRITEDVEGRRNAVVIPTSGLAQFREALEQLAAAVAARPPPAVPPVARPPRAEPVEG